MTFAPVLQEVAARISGTEPPTMRTEPSRWAYALREAVSLVAPDWIVTHHDLQLEADAVRSAAPDLDDALDAPLEQAAAASAALELTETLTSLYPQAVVAASVSGPAAIAARLLEGAAAADPSLDPLDALDLCGDALAGLAAAQIERGAARVVVWEPSLGPFEAADVEAAHRPLLRRLETLGAAAVLRSSPELSGDGYAAHAMPSSGRAATLIPLDAFPIEDGDGRDLIATIESAPVGDVVLTDGPIPRDCSMSALAGLGRRSR